MSHSFMLHLVWGHEKEKKICHKDEMCFQRELDYRTALVIWGFSKL